MNRKLSDHMEKHEIIVANKRAALALTILCSIISLAYVVEIFKKTRTLGYVALVVLLSMLPVVLAQIEIRRKPDSELARHIIAIGYAISYTFVLMTTENVLVFTYVFPMLIIVTLYNDMQFINMLGIGVCIVNFIAIFFFLRNGVIENTAIAEIQGLITVVIVIAITLVTGANISSQTSKMKRLAEESSKTEKLLDGVLGVSGSMSDTVVLLGEQMSILKESMEKTLISMNEVSKGSGEASQAAQDQLVQTQEISSHIENVSAAANTITDNVGVAQNAVMNGKDNITRMQRLTVQVDKAGKDVASVLATFSKTAQEMNSITDIITNVASQTSLLALNASIEAARAGEAGRGFAVVASEISKLASQTSDATESITRLISDVVSQVKIMVETVEKLLNAGNEETKCAEDTAQSFDQIMQTVDSIKNNSAELGGIVSSLSIANEKIVTSVQTTSAVSEEVTAHAEETYAVSDNSQKVVTYIDSLVDKLNGDAERLKAQEKA
ncbi:MAG: hypothetical protein K6E62_09735 [Lachnospiraceae bacterium]|nr:hypothetical protein [Lachnospiraceae bacterium]